MARSHTILCVDDDAVAQLTYHSILTERGYDARLCYDGDEVLPTLENVHVDVILLDLRMPKISGLGVCQLLRKDPRYASIPIIVISATDKEKTIVEALSSGVEDYLVKPVRPSELLAKISVVLNRCDAKSSVGLTVGEDYANDYLIIGRLGSTPGSTVYHARDVTKVPELDVVLKLVDQNAGATLLLPPRELNTDRRYMGLTHRSVPKLHDIRLADGQFVLVSEYLPSTSLEGILHRMGQLTDDTVAMLIHKLCDTLRWFEEQELLHLNVKPSNVLITQGGHVKLVDPLLLWRPGTVKCVPQFSAPELLAGEEHIDGRADVFSTGVIAYYAATRELPYPPDSALATLRRQLRGECVPIQQRDPDVTEPLAGLISDMIKPSPEERCTLAEASARAEQLLR